MYSRSHGISSVVISTCFGTVMLLWIGRYSCLLFRMCDAYADWGSLFMYVIYFLYLRFKERPVGPTYDM
jgi:hypothetical protein